MQSSAPLGCWRLASTALLGGLTGIKGGYNTRVLSFVFLRGPWSEKEIDAFEAPAGAAIYLGYVFGCCATVPMVARMSRRAASSTGEMVSIAVVCCEDGLELLASII